MTWSQIITAVGGVTTVFGVLTAIVVMIGRVVEAQIKKRGITEEMAKILRKANIPLDRLTKKELAKHAGRLDARDEQLVKAILRESTMAFFVVLVIGFLATIGLTTALVFLIIYRYGEARAVTVSLRPVNELRAVAGEYSLQYRHPSNGKLIKASGTNGEIPILGLPWNLDKLVIDSIALDPFLVRDNDNNSVVKERRPFVVKSQSDGQSRNPWTFAITGSHVTVDVCDVALKVQPRPDRDEIAKLLQRFRFGSEQLANVKGKRREGATILTVENCSGMPIDFYAFDCSRAFSDIDILDKLKGNQDGANLCHFYTSKKTALPFEHFDTCFPKSPGWFAFYVVHTPIDLEQIVYLGLANVFYAEDVSQQPRIEVVRNDESSGVGFLPRFYNCVVHGEAK